MSWQILWFVLIVNLYCLTHLLSRLTCHPGFDLTDHEMLTSMVGGQWSKVLMILAVVHVVIFFILMVCNEGCSSLTDSESCRALSSYTCSILGPNILSFLTQYFIWLFLLDKATWDMGSELMVSRGKQTIVEKLSVEMKIVSC